MSQFFSVSVQLWRRGGGGVQGQPETWKQTISLSDLLSLVLWNGYSFSFSCGAHSGPSLGHGSSLSPVHDILTSPVLRALLVLSLLSQFFFFLSQNSRPDFLKIPYSTSCLCGVRTSDINRVFCPNSGISSQIYEVFPGLKLLIATTYLIFPANSILPYFPYLISLLGLRIFLLL